MNDRACHRPEPTQTVADVKLSRIVADLESTIHNTGEIVLHKCPGTEELRPEYIKKLRRLYFTLHDALRLTEDN